MIKLEKTSSNIQRLCNCCYRNSTKGFFVRGPLRVFKMLKRYSHLVDPVVFVCSSCYRTAYQLERQLKSIKKNTKDIKFCEYYLTNIKQSFFIRGILLQLKGFGLDINEKQRIVLNQIKEDTKNLPLDYFSKKEETKKIIESLSTVKLNLFDRFIVKKFESDNKYFGNLTNNKIELLNKIFNKYINKIVLKKMEN